MCEGAYGVRESRLFLGRGFVTDVESAALVVCAVGATGDLWRSSVDMKRIVLHCIVLYCIVLYCIVLYCIVLYCIVL